MGFFVFDLDKRDRKQCTSGNLIVTARKESLFFYAYY
jgi:hypothetical protein